MRPGFRRQQIRMKCPKCNHIQPKGPECRKCGIMINKFIERLEQEKEEKRTATKRARARQRKKKLVKTTLSWVGYITVFVGIIILQKYYFPEAEKVPHQISTAIQSSKPVTTKSEKPATATQAATSSLSIKARLDKTHAPKTRLDRVRNATVTISSNLGTGTGFFITSKCQIITSRQLVQVNDQQRSELESQHELLTFSITQEEQNLIALQTRFFQEGQPVKNKALLQQQLQAQTQALEAKKTQLEALKTRLATIGNMNNEVGEITVTLVDGSQHPVIDLHTSETYDLALLSIPGTDAPVVPLSTISLSKGQPLHVFGPNSNMIDGIMVAYRDRNSQKMIQTDITSSPQYQGSPLVEAYGNIIGMNSIQLIDNSGVLSAIPIRTVMDQFSPYLMRPTQ